MEVKSLTIDQTVIAKAEIGLIKGFVSAINTATVTSTELSKSLARLELSESLMLKTVDSAFSSFLTACLSPLKIADQTARALFVKDLESKFQSQRATKAGQILLDQVLAPLLSQLSPLEIWIPGCGEAYEAAWVEARFPKVPCHYLDIDVTALDKARSRLEGLKSAAKVSAIDLTDATKLPDGRPDLALFFNPFVIDHVDYQRLVMTLADKKTTDAKADTYLSSLTMSPTSRKIYDNILARMEKKNFVSITMDLAEAHVISNYFRAKNIPVTCYRNPYAIKNLASHILGKRNPKTEPKIYHYVLLAQTT